MATPRSPRTATSDTSTVLLMLYFVCSTSTQKISIIKLDCTLAATDFSKTDLGRRTTLHIEGMSDNDAEDSTDELSHGLIGDC